jgi:hypothetical protein
MAAATAHGAGEPGPTVVKDPHDAIARAPDLTRVQLGMTSDGRLRAAITLAQPWVAKDLLASSGPPGSICLRLWTATKPGSAPPDYLVCATAHQDGETLRASVLQTRAGEPLRRVDGATVGFTSQRTMTMRFSQKAVGRPATIRFAAEATKPGCIRVSCVDTAPDAPKTATFKPRGTT